MADYNTAVEKILENAKAGIYDFSKYDKGTLNKIISWEREYLGRTVIKGIIKELHKRFMDKLLKRN